jgi:hypothetical protein
MVFKTFYQETDSVFGNFIYFSLVALSVFSFAKCLTLREYALYSFSSLPPNHGNPPDAFCFCFNLLKVAS